MLSPSEPQIRLDALFIPPYLRRAQRTLLVLLFVWIVALVFFRSIPQQDIAVSAHYFSAQPCVEAAKTAANRVCGFFPLAHSETWRFVRWLGMKIPQVMGLFTLAWFLWLWLHPMRPSASQLAAPALGLLALFLGPTLITNWIFKSWWGRPRPFQTELFGADAPFILPGSISSYCNTNCSFVSGEAAAGFWMLWIVPFVPSRWRWPVAFVILAFAIGVSGLRVAFGRHFLSDVAMAGLTSLVAIAMAALILQTGPAQRWLQRVAANRPYSTS